MIAAELGLHAETVKRALTDTPRSAPPPRPSPVDPYQEFIEQTLRKHPRLRATRLFQMIRVRGYSGSVRQLRRRVAIVRPVYKEAFLRLRSFRGEQAQVDWAHFGRVRVGGTERKLSGFVMTLSHSRALYLEFFFDQTLLGSGGYLAALGDHLRGPDQEFGQLSYSCHPNCRAAALLARNKKTGDWAPVSAFFDIEQFMKDVDVIVDKARGRRVSLAQVALSLVRNFDESKAPSGLTIPRVSELVRGRMGGKKARASGGGTATDWEFMWIASMWFQDLWTYDLRRTEMCVIPYGTQEGEISFCAYNTGCRLATDRREHAHGRDDQGVVRREGSPRDLRGRSADELQRQDAARAPRRVRRGGDARDGGRPGLGRGLGSVRLRELRERLAPRRDHAVPKLGATSCLPRRARSCSRSASCAGNQAAAGRSW